MANTGWINASNGYITFRNLKGAESVGNDSFVAKDMSANGGYANLSIDIGEELIGYGTINSVSVKATCKGARSMNARATARFGYISSGSDNSGSFSWQKTYSEEVPRSGESAKEFSHTYTPSRSTDGKYHILIGIVNNIALLSLTVNVTKISIYIDYTPATYTITWANVDGNGGSVTSQVQRYALPVCPVTPSKATDERYTYYFTGWEPAIPSEGATADATYTAQFHATPRSFEIIVKPNNEAYGTVSGGGTYYYNEKKDLIAIPAEGYRIADWLKDGVSVGRQSGLYIITVTGDATYVVIFEKLPPRITATQLLYSNKQISAENKVPVGEYFRIVVGVESYD